jgi:hypothetical protein
VKVKCFGCDASIEADGADDVVDAFVVHGKERHTWSYPEEAIRNYARNYAEAGERLTGGTERLSEIGDVTVLPMSEVLRSRCVFRQPRLGLMLLPRTPRAGDARAT